MKAIAAVDNKIRRHAVSGEYAFHQPVVKHTIKRKCSVIEEKLAAYLNAHPVALWAFSFIGMPLLVLAGVFLCTAVFGSLVWALTLMF